MAVDQVRYLCNSKMKDQEIFNRDRAIKGLEVKLAEKDLIVEKLLADLEKGKESTTQMMKKLEETQIALADSMIEIHSLRDKLDNVSETEMVMKELKLAKVGEETSKKALDEMALALKEVGREACRLKEQVCVGVAELQHSRGEEERLKSMIKNNDDMYKRELEEARRVCERLREEAEETLLGWAHKESVLLECLRTTEQAHATMSLSSTANNVDHEALRDSIFEHQLEEQVDNERNSTKKRALFRRLGDLIITRKKQGLAI